MFVKFIFVRNSKRKKKLLIQKFIKKIHHTTNYLTSKINSTFKQHKNVSEIITQLISLLNCLNISNTYKNYLYKYFFFPTNKNFLDYSLNELKLTEND